MKKPRKATAQNTNSVGARRSAHQRKGKLRSGPSREGSKLASMIVLLRRPKGATVEQMMTATGWQAHSVRGAISGAVKKKNGFTVNSAVEAAGARVYRIVG